LISIIVVNIWQWTGFSMLMYIAGIANLPSEVLDAAFPRGPKPRGLPML
jgi:multiple sugar transport system permease protein/raffinose/stachyose/melibiose transport system permease protein